jgi:protein gp37
LFHDDVPAKYIADVFGVMAATPQHTFQVLTKRPERMLNMLGAGRMGAFDDAVEECMAMYTDAPLTWPLPNVHLGVSIEDPATADERITLLLRTPAAVRWVSAEPLLAAVDLRPFLDGSFVNADISRPDLDWVVVGGESGPDARPMHPDWVRQIRDDCNDTRTPFLFKQWGEFRAGEKGQSPGDLRAEFGRVAESWPKDMPGVHTLFRVGKKAAGRLLDGVLHDAYPEACL